MLLFRCLNYLVGAAMNPKTHDIKFPDIEPQFIINKKGIKTGVYLDIKSYEKLLEEIEGLYLCSMARIVEETDKKIAHESK